MEGVFKKCPNGHRYQGETCPYCKTGKNVGVSTSLKTDVYPDGSEEHTQLLSKAQDYGSDESRTTVIMGQRTTDVGGIGVINVVQQPNQTVFGEETEIEVLPDGKKIEIKVERSSRKLVGWLVTYSFDAMGVDYKLKEGRNTIGRDVNCNITVNDSQMTGKHATILFQDGVFFLKDEFSTHGTFVNDVKMRPDSSQEINDGDKIRLGKTDFKFRIAL